MKVKTSITLSEGLLEEVDHLEPRKNRSAVIEEALKFFLRKRLQALREEKDRKILNQRANELNEEAEDVLSYQVEL